MTLRTTQEKLPAAKTTKQPNVHYKQRDENEKLAQKRLAFKTKTNKRGVSIHRHEKGYVMKQKEKQIKVLKQLRNCGNKYFLQILFVKRAFQRCAVQFFNLVS